MSTWLIKPPAEFDVSFILPDITKLLSPVLILPVTDNAVKVPTDVIFPCAAVVTVPAVVALVAAPVKAPTNEVLVTLVSPATVVTVEPKVNAVLPNVTLALASLACANVPDETLLAFNAVNELPFPVKTPVLAVNAAPVVVPTTFNDVNVPTLVILP